jgi:hypothetical protein
MRIGLGFFLLAFGLLACGKVLELPPDEHRDGGAEADACTTHSECLAASSETDPAICVDGRCTPLLLPPQCPLVLPQSDDLWRKSLEAGGPEPFIFGAFTDVRRGTAGLSGVFAYDYDLAVSEVVRTLGGLPAAGGEVRPVLGVVCSNVFDTPAELDRAVDHLANDLKVPAILATLNLDDLQRAFDRTSESQVFFLNLRDADPSLVARASEGRMWHMLAGWDSLVPGYQALVDRTVRHLVSTGALAPDEPARVALVRAYDSPETNTLGTALLEHLVVNGAPFGSNPTGLSGTVLLADVPSVARAEHDYNAFIDELRSFEPHIVIFSTDDAFVPILEGLESRRPQPAPFYLMSPNQPITSDAGAIHAFEPDLYKRVAGINFSAAPDARDYDAFQARFDAAYPDMATRAQQTENQYDGPWYLLYAAAAARGGWPLVGPDLDLGMRQLLSGDKYSVGPDDLPKAMAELKPTGSSITLYGTMGPPNFDPATGSRSDPGTVWCVDASGALHTDVLRLDDNGKLSGTFPCFDFDD